MAPFTQRQALTEVGAQIMAEVLLRDTELTRLRAYARESGALCRAERMVEHMMRRDCFLQVLHPELCPKERVVKVFSFACKRTPSFWVVEN